MDLYIRVKGARHHNLKNIDVNIPKNSLTTITGPSGSGKSSLAFDTIYAEGQRRYVQSLSAYARQFLQVQNKPEVDGISGLSPAIAIDQKTTSKNPRSTVGTITEIYDYLRLLFARIGIPYSPHTGLPIKSQTITEMADVICALPKGIGVSILAPIAKRDKGEFRRRFIELNKAGFSRFMIEDDMHVFPDVPILDKNIKHNISVVIDRFKIREDIRQRIVESIDTGLRISKNGVIEVTIIDIPEGVEYKGDKFIPLSSQYACPVSGFQVPEIAPRLFSFNSPIGACKTCEGLGKRKFFDPELVIPNNDLPLLNAECIEPWKNKTSKRIKATLEALSKEYNFSLHSPFSEVPQDIKDIIFYGSGRKNIEISYKEGYQDCIISQPFDGVVNILQATYNSLDMKMREHLSKYLSEQECLDCRGFRLSDISLCVKVEGMHIGEVSNMNIKELASWSERLMMNLSEYNQKIADKILKEIYNRSVFLLNVGLDYLSMSREAGTLSGGESQRIRLASQIGSGLTGVLYVLDEPSIGLHQRDNAQLIKTLKSLRDLGNTVLVVEHDDDTMRCSDYIIDIGPGAGVHGGDLIAHGTLDDIKKSEDSITGQYLSGKKKIAIPKQKKIVNQKYINLTKASGRNLQDISLKIPLGKFNVVTGVSGSGKSTLILDTLYPAIKKVIEPRSILNICEYKDINGTEYIDKIIDVDQSPIGRTPRSNPSTYIGVFQYIRDWFTQLPESRARGYKPGRFSFNVKGGRCEACQGDGEIKIEMHFLPDIYVKCEACQGMKYNKETLEIKYQGKNIYDVLKMTVEDSIKFFENIPVICNKIQTLSDVGLGYLELGQSSTTLSGGEAQRIKLAKELTKKSTGRTMYIFDEPTTGLHHNDVNNLIQVLYKLVDLGNTMIIIEHNMEVIKTAAHIIDIGPGGGDKGGRIVAEGSVRDILNSKHSITGTFLKKHLEHHGQLGEVK